jgi:hypothetical protein
MRRMMPVVLMLMESWARAILAVFAPIDGL